MKNRYISILAASFIIGCMGMNANADTLNVGDIVKFGEYEQDGNIFNGKENIEWDVLEVKENKALLFCKYALVNKEYNKDYVTVSWESCDLREWLNGKFFKDSFSKKEQERIAEVSLPDEGIADKIFLLSADELTQYFTYQEEIMKQGTKALMKEFKYYDSNGDLIPYYSWWLRTTNPENENLTAFAVRWYGEIYDSAVNWTGHSVCPALWITFESDTP